MIEISLVKLAYWSFRAKLIPAKKQLGDKVAKKIKKKVRRQPPPSDEDSESEQVSLNYWSVLKT